MSKSEEPAKIEFISRGIVFHEERVLMCRHRKHGYVYLPGGHVEPGESASDALVREMMEECNCEVKIGPCLLIEEHRFTQMAKPRHEVNIYFRMTVVAARQIVSQEDHIDFVWLDIDRLANFDVRPRHAIAVVTNARCENPLAWQSIRST
jgi:8-oxo-dGTP diphosphatase